MKNKVKGLDMMVLPLGETVLVKLDDKDDKKTESGIIIPATADMADEILPLAEIIAIGPDVKSAIEVGMTVLISKYAGAPAPGGARILPLDQVLAICQK